MNTGAQPLLIGKNLSQKLRLTADDLAPCPFTIVTSVGHKERATCYTREPLQLSFRVKPGDPPAPLLLRCAVTNETNYDILVGQQTLYLFRTGTTAAPGHYEDQRRFVLGQAMELHTHGVDCWFMACIATTSW